MSRIGEVFAMEAHMLVVMLVVTRRSCIMQSIGGCYGKGYYRRNHVTGWVYE